MTDTTRERVHGLADAHAADLASLELLAALDPDTLADDTDGAGLDRNTRELLADLIDANGADEATDDPIGAWLSGALDVWVTADLDVTGTLRHVKDVVVLLSTGGPHVELRDAGGTEVAIFVVWGSDRADRLVSAPMLATRLDELADTAQDGGRR